MTRCANCEYELAIREEVLRASRNEVTDIVDLLAEHGIIVSSQSTGGIGYGTVHASIGMETRTLKDAEKVLIILRQHRVAVSSSKIFLVDGKVVLRISIKKLNKEVNVVPPGTVIPIDFSR